MVLEAAGSLLVREHRLLASTSPILSDPAQRKININSICSYFSYTWYSQQTLYWVRNSPVVLLVSSPSYKMLQSQETNSTRNLGFHALPHPRCFLRMQLALGANYSSVSHWAGFLRAKATRFLSTWKPWMAHFQPCANFISQKHLGMCFWEPFSILAAEQGKRRYLRGLRNSPVPFSVFFIKRISEKQP